MSSVSAAAAGAAAPPASNPLIARIFGVIRRPRATFRVITAAPRWAAALLVLTAVGAIAQAWVLGTPVGQQALVDQWERTAVAFGREVDDAGYAESQALSGYGALYGVATAMVTGPVVAIACATAVFALYRPADRRPVSYSQVLAVVVHAGTILTLRQVISAPLIYARESTASATSLGAWLPMLDEASPVARFFGMLDLFVLWWLLVLAIGVAVLYARRVRPLALTFIGVYVGLALVLAATMAALGGTT